MPSNPAIEAADVQLSTGLQAVAESAPVVDDTEETVLLGATGIHLRIKKRLLDEPSELRRRVKVEGRFSNPGTYAFG